MNIIIDNYDSFTYNLVQYVATIDSEIRVYKNDYIDINEIITLNPDHIIISPGPGRPEDAGISVDIIKKLKDRFPILGVCLGHQAIGFAFGASIINAKNVVHGKTSEVYHDSSFIFKDISSPFTATRYHSLIIDDSSLPKELEITANTSEGLIMAIRHKQYMVYGLQFDPESILTNQGFQMIKNFLNED